MSYYYPDDILANILVTLPFKSLMRFRCVSKSWRDLITRSRLVIAEIGEDDKQLYAFDSVAEKGRGLCVANAPKQLISPATLFPGQSFAIIGSCNGILCLRIGKDLVLWNPFTCTYFELPSPPDEFTGDLTRPALGYDHINDDYKVVRWLVKLLDDKNHNINHRPQNELCVYSLKQNSWRMMRDGVQFELPEDYSLASTMVNGSAHWLESNDNYIVAFDLATYEFQKMSLVGLSRVRYKNIFCLNGYLSFVSYRDHHRNDVWVMEEYGVKNSWKRIASINELQPGNGEIRDPRPVVILEEGRKLLFSVLGNKLMVYDIEKKSFSKVAIRAETEASEDATYWVCFRSLVNPASYPMKNSLRPKQNLKRTKKGSKRLGGSIKQASYIIFRVLISLLLSLSKNL